MNRSRTIFSNLRFSNSLLWSPIPATCQLLTQVIHFSPFSPYFPLNQSHTSYYFDTRQKLCISSVPSSFVQLLLVSDWSPELETALENSSPILNHETVIYILKKLDQNPRKAWDFFNWVNNRNYFKPSSPLYSLLLRILAKNLSVKYFWNIVRKMKEQGFYVDEDTYSTILVDLNKEKMDCDAKAFELFFYRMLELNAMDSVVKRVVSVVLGAEWGSDVEKELVDIILLTDNFVIRVLEKLIDYPAKALQFFRWICKVEAYQSNTVTYNAILRVLARDDSIGDFWSVVVEMKNAGHEMDIDTYCKISRQFQKNKLFEEGVKLYEFMMDSPFRPSVQDCSMFLRSLAASDSPDLSLIKRIVSKYEATGNSLPKAVYDGMHGCLTSAGKFDEAENIRKHMKNAGHKLDNITFNQLLFGLCKSEKLEEANNVCDEMKARGLVSDIKTWTMLIQGHCAAANEVDMALRCFAKMKGKVFIADTIQLLLVNYWSPELERMLENSNHVMTHETVIYVLKNLCKEPHKAWDFFNWVHKRNEFKPSAPLYSLLLRILANKNSMEYFWSALRKMEEQGFYISAETYYTILAILKEQKMNSEAISFMSCKHYFHRILEENGRDSLVKNVVGVIFGTKGDNQVEKKLGDTGILFTDNIVIRVLEKLRDYPARALRFFHWIRKNEAYKSNTVTYNAILRVLARDDSIGDFWSVVVEMKNAGHEMDMDTYCKISRQFQKNKLFKEGVKLCEFMMDSPFKPSVQDCSMLLRTLAASDSLDLSLVRRVVSKYEATGNSLPKAVYGGIHSCLTKAGKFNEAKHVRKDMRNAGYEPDNITYNQLVFGLCKAEKLEEANKVVFDEMEALGLVPDIKTWTLLIHGHCVAANEVDMGLTCFSKSRDKNCNADADQLDVPINGSLGENKLDRAYSLLVEMMSKARLRPLPATFKLVSEKLLDSRKIDQAFTVLRLTKQWHGFIPLFEPFVKYISKFGTVEDGAVFLKECPSTFDYIGLFQSFFKEGRHSEAKDLLCKCPRRIAEHPKIVKLFHSAASEDAAGAG